MTIWIPDVAKLKGPIYLRIAEALQEDVACGRLQPGTRLPTHRELAYRLAVTVGTISRAYLEAERRGLVSGEVGRGTFVRARSDRSFAVPHRDRNVIDLSLNRPTVIGVPPEFAATLANLSRQNDLASLLTYQSELGSPAHREAASAWLKLARVEVSPEQIAITCGAQHGLYCALIATMRPGDTLLVESLTYPALKSIARQLGLRLRGVAMDQDGLIPEALEAACSDVHARALFTMPTLHNPTTTTLPPARRHAIVEIARRHDLLIIEDDIYGFLLDAPPEPIFALAPERTFYVTSISKNMAAGLRLGYVAAPADFIGSVGAALRSTVWMTPPLSAEIATRWINDGTGLRLAEARRQQARRHQAIAARHLAGQRIETHSASLHFWLHLPEPWQWSDFVAAAESRGVLITPPDAFLTGQETAPHAVRVCLCAVENEAQLDTGLGRLAELLASRPEPRLSVV